MKNHQKPYTPRIHGKQFVSECSRRGGGLSAGVSWTDSQVTMSNKPPNLTSEWKSDSLVVTLTRDWRTDGASPGIEVVQAQLTLPASRGIVFRYFWPERATDKPPAACNQ